MTTAPRSSLSYPQGQSLFLGLSEITTSIYSPMSCLIFLPTTKHLIYIYTCVDILNMLHPLCHSYWFCVLLYLYYPVIGAQNSESEREIIETGAQSCGNTVGSLPQSGGQVQG